MAELPDDVRSFLREHIPSVMQLEVLLHLRAASGDCRPLDVSRQVGGSVDAAITCLTSLERSGLVRRADLETDLCYRFAPSSDELEHGVEAVSEAYARRKVAVVTEIFSRPDDALRSFSDAFKIRRDR